MKRRIQTAADVTATAGIGSRCREDLSARTGVGTWAVRSAHASISSYEDAARFHAGQPAPDMCVGAGAGADCPLAVQGGQLPVTSAAHLTA